VLHAYPSHPLWFYCPNNVLWKVQVLKLLIMKSSPASRYFLPLRSKCSLPIPYISLLFAYPWDTPWRWQLRCLPKGQDCYKQHVSDRKAILYISADSYKMSLIVSQAQEMAVNLLLVQNVVPFLSARLWSPVANLVTWFCISRECFIEKWHIRIVCIPSFVITLLKGNKLHAFNFQIFSYLVFPLFYWCIYVL